LAIVPGSTQWENDCLLDIQVILSVCAGLIITDTAVSTVCLVHYTAQEYLSLVMGQQFPTTQVDIAHTLLTLLTFDQFNPEFLQSERYTDYERPGLTLLKYGQYCLAHAAGEHEGLLIEMILKFLGQAQTWNRFMRGRWKWNSVHPWDYQRWPKNATPLWVAAAANLLETAKYIMNHAMFSKKSKKQKLQDIREAVDVASSYGHLEMVKYLTNKYGLWWKALHTASHVIGSNKAPFRDALRAASVKGHLDIVQGLIEKGANVNTQRQHSNSALWAASRNGHLEIVRVLVRNGANVNAQGKYCRTALQAASSMGRSDIVQVFVKKGANVNAQDKYGDTALWAASRNGHLDIVQVLIKKGANVNAQHDTSLQAACWQGHLEIVRVLVENGANVNAHHEHGDSALWAASSKGHLDIVQVLIEKGANVNAQGKCGTALQAASSMGHLNIVQVLIRNGAIVNIQGRYDHSALWVASWHGHLDIVQVLIEKGANVNAQDKYGRTVLRAASSRGHLNIVQFLIRRGANINAQNGGYDIPLQAAPYSNP
jgi:ankyrin repeat protein